MNLEPRILIDISRLCYRRLYGRLPTGIDRVSLEYIRHYAGGARAVLSRSIFSSVLSRTDSERAFRLLLDARAPATLAILWLFFKAFLGWRMRPGVTDCVLLNTCHTGLHHAGYATDLMRGGARPVYFVHDLIPITHPQYCRAGERERHETRMRTVLKTGRGIIANSRDTLAALARFAEGEGLRMPPATVAPLATSLPRAEAGERPIAAPYFVVVGTIEPRKNHLLLLQLWRDMAARYKVQDSRYKIQDTRFKVQDTRHKTPVTRHPEKSEAIPRLVIIGYRGWENREVFELLDHSGELRGVVFEHSACSDEALAAWLRHARALLFPSFTEGYGLPLAEALSLGTPAIAADLPVFREVAGEIPEYASPLDGGRWMELIADYASPESARRAAQLERMKVFRATTWEKHFEKVDDFLEQEMGNGK